jgi:hypothetical protein
VSAYLVFIRECTLDAAELENYRSKIRATFAAYRGILVQGLDAQ